MSALLEKFRSLSLSSELNNEQLALATQWETVVKSGQIQGHIDELNLRLRDHSFVLATVTPTETDAEVFESVFPIIKELLASSKDVKGHYAQYRHIIRWCAYLQELLDVPENIKLSLNFDLELPREIIEKKKKDDSKKQDDAGAKKTADSAKAESKDKEQQAPRGKPDEETLKKLREEAKAKKAAKKAANAQQGQQQDQQPQKPRPSAIDFRIGFIQKCVKHPDADSLYVSTIDVGDEEGPRTVCSGLVKYFPLEAMQERYVVAVCNLKPVNMRGVKSTAMVLCGSDENNVEFVQPPAGSKPGEKVFFEGFGDEEPAKQLNPKKKVWEQLQPNFSTNESLEVFFKDEEDNKPKKLTNARGDSFKVATITNANVR
ncbi:LANO_0F01772g1_1 [Lachancea nothofagi CBS 11611]|uniref:LANO_0F01772g1_1 n=1 Tax=Lachancea nothofagi CBS 11611 TaxID=1266666 RepID=A0A1G4K6I8_9SACH|nr:LANO_0F01772g1_1 [Lachancea nothofagi CBS 11611]